MADIQTIFAHTNFTNDRQKALAAVVYLSSLAKRRMDKLLAPRGLSLNQYRVLRGLKKLYPKAIPVYKLTEFVVEDDADVSRLVNKLEERHLVIRQPDKVKRNVSPVIITLAGIDTIQQIDKRLDFMIEPITTINPEQCEQLKLMLEGLIDSFATHAEEEPYAVRASVW